MKPLKLVAPSSKLVPLLPKNRLAPAEGYDSLLDDWLARSRSPHTLRMYRSNITAFFQSLGYQITPDILAQFLLLDRANASN